MHGSMRMFSSQLGSGRADSVFPRVLSMLPSPLAVALREGELENLATRRAYPRSTAEELKTVMKGAWGRDAIFYENFDDRAGRRRESS